MVLLYDMSLLIFLIFEIRKTQSGISKRYRLESPASTGRELLSYEFESSSR